MKSVLFAFAAIGLFFSSAASGGEIYHIRKVVKINSPLLIHIGNDWRKDLPNRVEATLRVKEPLNGAQPFVRAYFYDKDNVLLKKFSKAPGIWMETKKGIMEVTLPKDPRPHEDFIVQFPIADEFQNVNYKTILIVFGDETQVDVYAYPSTDYSALSFDEQALVSPHSN